MIAIISSTIYPSAISSHSKDEIRAWISPEVRLAQTQKTIQSLLNIGVSEIYIADNSGKNWLSTTNDLLKPAKVYVFNHHQYCNKGISEIYLLLSVLEFIPSNTPILKISGRYTVTKNYFKDVSECDVAAKIYTNDLTKPSMSTRCYLVRDKNTYEIFLKKILCEMYGYSSRIVGLRSFARIIYNSLFPSRDSYPYYDPRYSLEMVSARILKIFNYKVCRLDTIGIEGYIAGNPNDLLRE